MAADDEAAAAATTDQPSMTKDEAPDWVPNRAFPTPARARLEKPPSLLSDTPAYEPPRPREPEEPSPTRSRCAPRTRSAACARAGATILVERAVTAGAAKQRANAALKEGDAALARKRYLAALCHRRVAGRARQVLIARKVRDGTRRRSETPLQRRRASPCFWRRSCA